MYFLSDAYLFRAALIAERAEERANARESRAAAPVAVKAPKRPTFSLSLGRMLRFPRGLQALKVK